MQEGCGCHRGSTGGQCCNDVLLATGLKNLYNCLELSRVELDLVILTNIQAFTPSEAMPGEKIKNNPEENAFLLPGRIPSFKNKDIQLLSSSDRKMRVWNSFKSVS